MAIFLNRYFSKHRFFINATYRSSHQRCSIKKAVLKSFTIFTRKQLSWSLFLTKLQVFRARTLLKIKLQHRSFPVNIANFLRTAILKNVRLICERLLLYLMEFLEQLVFREAIFKNSLSDILTSNFYFTFNLLKGTLMQI